MACDYCNANDESRSVTRQINRALRNVNRALRRHKVLLQDEYDQKIAALFDIRPSEAELALRRLWEEGGFQPPCGSEDYDTIVDTSIRALKAYRDAAVNTPAQCHTNLVL